MSTRPSSAELARHKPDIHERALRCELSDKIEIDACIIITWLVRVYLTYISSTLTIIQQSR